MGNSYISGNSSLSEIIDILYILYRIEYMSSTITATQVRNEFAQIINRAYFQGEEFIVEKQGVPVAKIIGYRRDIKKQKTPEFSPPVYDMGGTEKIYTRKDMYE